MRLRGLYEIATMDKIEFTVHELNLRKIQVLAAGRTRHKTSFKLPCQEGNVAIAFGAFGTVAQVCVSKDQNVNENFFCTQVLTEVKKH